MEKENIEDLKLDIKELEELLELCNLKLKMLKNKLPKVDEYVCNDSCDMFLKVEPKTFKITNSFNPVQSWIDSFKKSNKWNNTLKWIVSNALKGIVYNPEFCERTRSLIMNIEKGKIISLDNNENYFVASTINHNNNLYALLINVNKDNDHIVVNKTSETTVELIENENEVSTLVLLLQENLY